MFRLQLLGGVALVGDAGTVVGRAVQKRRLALLARLARAPGRAVSRDKLVALLWPETDSDDARHLLSVSLHELRRALGDEAIISRGDDIVLGLRIESDVEAFTAVLPSEPSAAVQLYRGPFMDGFFVSDSAELNEWIEGEREELKQQYLQALEQVARARAQAGDLVGSVDAWRKLAAQDPFNGRIAYELMLALDRAGDRAGALQHARVHETLLQTEFGSTADEQVRQLSEQLRAGTLSPTARAIPPAVQPTNEAAVVGVPATASASAPLDVRPQARPRLKRGRARARRWIIPALVAIGAVSIARLMWISWLARDDDDAPRASVAVLPFRNMNATDSLVYFSDGVSEEITSALSKVPGLHVASRTSAFLLRDSVDARAAARRLNVRNVLEGTVRSGGNRMKITARLINADDGKAKWSEDFDLPFQVSDILSTQEQIAQAVVEALSIRLLPAEKSATLVPHTTTDLEALDAYYRGRSHYYKRTIPDLQRALAYFEQATKRDPRYALAHTAIADVYIILGAHDYGLLEPKRAFDAALRATQQALRLAPTLAEAHVARGAIYFNYEWDWAGAEREFKSAIDLNPGYAHAYHMYSLMLATQGRLEESRRAITRARELDPLSLVMATSYARNLYFSREFDAALAGYSEVLRKDPAFPTAHAGAGLALIMQQQYDGAIEHFNHVTRSAPIVLPLLRGLTGYAHARAGRPEQARAELRALGQYPAGTYIAPEYRALIHIGLKDYDRAVREFELAYQGRSGSIAYLAAEPILDPIREYPAFVALTRRVGLAR